MSTNRCVPPAVTMADTVGIAVFEVVITSSPGRRSSVRSASSSASVPLPTPTPCPAPQYAASSRSKLRTLSPRIRRPERAT